MVRYSIELMGTEGTLTEPIRYYVQGDPMKSNLSFQFYKTPVWSYTEGEVVEIIKAINRQGWLKVQSIQLIRMD